MAKVIPQSALDKALRNFKEPGKHSHKGQNGRSLVIGGSKIFHAASIWAAEVASRIVDIVHYSSTEENNQIMINLKSKFTDGIVIPNDQIIEYVKEDDTILIGPGMERGDISKAIKEDHNMAFDAILAIKKEEDYTYALIRHLIVKFPDKKFVFDAAALQVMEKDWLTKLTQKAVVTPHSKEFEILFDKPATEENIIECAKKYNCIIIMKNITDYISDGSNIIKVEGGNAGLAKGGSGDVLAGLITAFSSTNDSVQSCVLASYILQETAEDLYKSKGLMYNTSDLINRVAHIGKRILYN